MLDFTNLSQYRENNQLEAKQALGGLPESIWETYSAFANTEGGWILLGVEELPDKSLQPVNLLDPQWLLDDLWTGLNDPNRVSANILTPEHIFQLDIDGNTILAIQVPKAPRHLLPIYIDADLYKGAYYRSGEGDYRFTAQQIDALVKKA
ncbi:MAG: ATP-binding protein [Oscillospiraceae bacterium]|nr:ATP-binding protein [Oscillospiraceae bacterium]